MEPFVSESQRPCCKADAGSRSRFGWFHHTDGGGGRSSGRRNPGCDAGSSGIRRLMVNNGGDIAFDLTPGTECRFGVFELKEAPELSTTVGIDDSSPVRGVATSGWRGRSQSLGIADSVTVLARSAAQADASATLVANAVNVDHQTSSGFPLLNWWMILIWN